MFASKTLLGERFGRNLGTRRRCRRDAHLLFLAPLALFFCVPSVGQAANDELAKDLLNTLLRQHILSIDTDEVQQILERLVAKTRFAKHVNFNRLPQSQSLNFYMLDRRLAVREDIPP